MTSANVKPLALLLVSYDTSSIVNGITAFGRSGQLKQGATLLFYRLTPMVLMLASCDANGIVNGPITF